MYITAEYINIYWNNLEWLDTDIFAWPDAIFQSQTFDHAACRLQVVGRRGNIMTSDKQSNNGQVLKNDNPTVYTYLLLSVKTSCSKEGWKTYWAMNMQLNRQKAFIVTKFKTVVNTIKSSSIAMSLYDGWHELYKGSEEKSTHVNDTERTLMSVHQIQKWRNLLSCDSSKQIWFNVLQEEQMSDQFDQVWLCNLYVGIDVSKALIWLHVYWLWYIKPGLPLERWQD